MQEIRWDGTDVLKANVDDKELLEAVHDKRNKTVIAHKSGSIITRTDGSQYEVWTDGSLRKIREKGNW